MELGFDEPCLTFYNHDGKIEYSDDWSHGVEMSSKRDRNQCLAPIYQQIFDWFREKHNLEGSFGATSQGSNEKGFAIIKLLDVGYELLFANYKLKTYPEARHACLEKLIELISKK